MDGVKIEKIAEAGSCELGESPHWDVEEQCLYYIDLRGPFMHKYCPGAESHAQATLGSGVEVGKGISFIVPVQGQKEKFLVGSGHAIYIVTWDGKSEEASSAEVVTKVEENLSESEVNDGKCDANGRLWFGTVGNDMASKKEHALYSLENGKVTRRLNEVMLSNGLAWNLDYTKFYYVDTGYPNVDEFDYDIVTGELANRKTLFSFEKTGMEGYPDGMTIDSRDNLWVASFMGSCIINIDTKKPNTIINKVVFPVKQVTALSFGGPKLDEMYVTTARYPIANEVFDGPDNGALYKVTGLFSGIHGIASMKAKI